MKLNNKGVTLLEVAIAVLLTGVIVSAALSLYVTQHKQLLVQDEISDMQSSMRAAVGEMTTSIRMAGLEIPHGFDCIVAHNTNPDTIAIFSNKSFDIQIEHAMPTPSAELRCDGHDISMLHDGDVLYIWDPILKSGEYFYASQIQYASSNIQHNTMSLSHCYPVGSTIIWLDSKKYYIDNSDQAHPKLMVQINVRPPEVFAENITDLQFKYILSSQAIVDVPPSDKMIREVVISVTARTNERDPEFQNQYRTRTLSTKVLTRNLAVN